MEGAWPKERGLWGEHALQLTGGGVAYGGRGLWGKYTLQLTGGGVAWRGGWPPEGPVW